MSTTGTTSNQDVNDLIEEAFERCGKELRFVMTFVLPVVLERITYSAGQTVVSNLRTIEQGVIPTGDWSGHISIAWLILFT